MPIRMIFAILVCVLALDILRDYFIVRTFGVWGEDD